MRDQMAKSEPLTVEQDVAQARLQLEALRAHHGQGGQGGALRAGVFGINDGLVSNFSLVLGVAGADPGRHFVLLAGIAGLLAGAFSSARRSRQSPNPNGKRSKSSSAPRVFRERTPAGWRLA